MAPLLARRRGIASPAFYSCPLASRRANIAKLPPVLRETDDGERYVLTLDGAWHDAVLSELRLALAHSTAQRRQVHIELLANCSLDSAALGLLLLLYGHQSKAGAALSIRTDSAVVRRTMHLQNVGFLLEGLAGSTPGLSVAQMIA
jgi:anti-anti-sigma regulatory factor